MTTTTLRLPIDVGHDVDRRTLNALTARAIRLALDARPRDTVVAELCAVAHRSPRLLDAAIGRLERALAEQHSRTVTRAVTDLKAARASLQERARAAG